MRLSAKSLRRGSRKQRTCTLELSRQESREALGAIFEAKRLEDYLPDKETLSVVSQKRMNVLREW